MKKVIDGEPRSTVRVCHCFAYIFEVVAGDVYQSKLRVVMNQFDDPSKVVFEVEP